jgi:hypothetical protein
MFLTVPENLAITAGFVLLTLVLMVANKLVEKLTWRQLLLMPGRCDLWLFTGFLTSISYLLLIIWAIYFAYVWLTPYMPNL